MKDTAGQLTVACRRCYIGVGAVDYTDASVTGAPKCESYMPPMYPRGVRLVRAPRCGIIGMSWGGGYRIRRWICIS